MDYGTVTTVLQNEKVPLIAFLFGIEHSFLFRRENSH